MAMKEFTIQEKAARYDVAIEKAKEMIKSMTNTGGVAKVDDIQYLFSEFKESDYEKIKKILYGWVYIEPVESFNGGFTKEQILAWIEKQGEKGTNWNEREIPNSTWSEEDEVGLSEAMWAIKQARTIAKDENDMGNLWYAERWLKSLKDRYMWKPSDMELEVLRLAAEKDGTCLMGLYEQLKKLKKE